MSKYFVRGLCMVAMLVAHPALNAKPPAAAARATAAASAIAPLRLDAPIPVGPQVKVGKLANGLTYYIQRNARPERKLELRLVVKAGSILEDEDQRGLAHFVEHMAFNGSTHFHKHELVSYLQSIGVGFGADLNAYTSFDETVYILPIPTDKPEHVAKAFQVLEDWAHGLRFDPDAIEKERGIVLEELRLGKGASDRMGKQIMPAIFNGSKYAERLPIGTEEVLRSFRPEALTRFYRDWYRPDLMAVVVVGDIEPARAEQLVKSHFARLKNPVPARPRPYAEIPARQATEALVVTDQEATGNAVLIRYPVQPVVEAGTIRAYRDDLVQALFSSMLNQRLQELSQLPEPPYMGASSSLGKLTPRYRSYNASAALGPRGAEAALTALVEENERARRFGFSAAELERVKKSLMRNYEQAWNERAKSDSATYAAEYIRNFLQQEAIPGIDTEYRYVRELVPGITLEELNAYARRTIPADSGKLVLYTGVTRPDTPQGAQLLGTVASAERARLHPHDDKAVATRLMERPPRAGTIVSETHDKALGLTRLELSNGVKVILKSTDFRNDQVLMSAARFGGQSLFGDQDILNARFANAIVASMGVREFSPLDMRKILAGKAAQVNVGLANYTDVVVGASGATDIETMLQLTWLKFQGVRRDEDLFKSYVGKQVEQARNQTAQPGARFGDAVMEALYNKHPRAPRTLRAEEYEQIDLDRSIDIFRERFSSARDLGFILVGSFDLAAIKPLLATYLGSLPTPELTVAYRDVGLRPAQGVVKREVRSGSEPKSTISLTFTGMAEFSEAEQLRLSALLEVVNLRIIDVLREKMALIYGGGASGVLSKIPYGNYSIGVTLPTGPEHVDKVIAATFAEIEKLQQDGPDAADLDKVKSNWIQNHRRSLRENGYWLGHLQTALSEGTDPAAILQVEKQVQALSGADIRGAARRYFNQQNYVQVVLNPETQAATTMAASGVQAAAPAPLPGG
ncbi:pitrilysin family protein [Massilia sp. MS-15]|uniref:M16 family metallopeptidase n=1 Tax=Massilia sp. MS-15 TaxID=2878200 RepID=UPI001CD5F211|nr:insulinase family protein [Massilia sp. MS-15]MCA1248393.1 insulinase family protein [Massilia sp. MS-15]